VLSLEDGRVVVRDPELRITPSLKTGGEPVLTVEAAPPDGGSAALYAVTASGVLKISRIV